VTGRCRSRKDGIRCSRPAGHLGDHYASLDGWNGSTWLNRTKPVCPSCSRADQVRPIVRGYPSPALERRAKRGEVVLGGCMVGYIDPLRYCKRCRASFNFARSQDATGLVARRSWIADDEGIEQYE